MVAVAAVVVLSVGAFAILTRDGGIPTGSALDVGGGGGILQPLPADTPLTLGIVITHNTSGDWVELVDARLVRLDPQLELLGFSALPPGPGPWGVNPPITALEHPIPGAVPLEDFPPLAPRAKDTQVVVMFALKAKPHQAGKAVGIEVVYRQDGKLRKQIFEEQVYVCWAPDISVGKCPGVDNEFDVFGEYEDEVEGRTGRTR